jgi:diguanylate cyclase (GGDEF)-like protein/excisionase family DNA binding protein
LEGLATSAQPAPATVSVTKAARLLGVHPNTVRAWSDQGRLPCLRINARGDRRFRLDELQAFLAEAAAANGAVAANGRSGPHGTIHAQVASGSIALRAREGSGAGADGAAGTARLERQLQKSETLRRISTDISSKLDLQVILSHLVDHSRLLFEADRAAVMERLPDGRYVAAVSRNLSERYLRFVEPFPTPSLAAEALTERRAIFAVDYADDPRGAGVRAAVIQEGFNTIAMAPLMGDDELLGLLVLYHDRPHPWDPSDLDTLDALAAQAGVAIVTARNYAKMAGWAAQLQSIQQLGGRLSRLTSVREIGIAIAAELGQLIDYHNVRVYRVAGDELVPVAWRGDAGEYVGYVEDQLRLKVGQGITGWVAIHGVAQYLPNAAVDPRARTIPGTEEDLAESMLVAPMTYEDRVLGVLVLSKLGLNQFSSDHLRLLEIYASLAAQAMANAETTERLNAQSATLERQLRSQRELLGITESILGTLEPTEVLDEIADRLSGLVAVDNIAIFVNEPAMAHLRPLIARGAYAERYMQRPIPADRGLVGWVFQNGQSQLVADQLTDARVYHFPDLGPVPGALIGVPLKARQGTAGVLLLERLGPEATFNTEELELVELFAGHASIAMQNAQAHHAVEVRARTDALTGLSNHGTFHERLAQWIARTDPFSLLMLDLDDFKSYNDRHGHQAGDRLLRSIAAALTSAVRETDAVFRYGGDEFALLLARAGAPTSAEAIAEKIRWAVRSVRLDGAAGGWPLVTCSIGVASFPADGRTKDALLLAADRACYVAKRQGRDRVATAAEGLALAAEFLPVGPTPVDEPTGPVESAGTVESAAPGNSTA